MKVPRRSFLAIFAVVPTLLIACGADTGDDSAPAKPAQSNRPPTPTVVSPEDRNLKSGATADYVLSVVSVKDPAEAVAAYKAKLPNSRLVAAELAFENANGKDVFDVDPTTPSVFDEKGQEYQAIKGALADGLKAISLKKGEKVQGWVAFEVPKDAKPAKVRYLVGLLATVTLNADWPK